MRKKAVMIPILLIFLLFIITSCGKQSNSSDKLDNDNVKKETSEISSKEKKDSASNEKLQGDTSTNQAISGGDLSKNASVIAKSDNNLTDSERQAIVEDLTNEIDRLINDVNQLEDL